MKKLRLVTATRLSKERFPSESLLCQSLAQFPADLLPELRVAYENREGLAALYNREMELCPPTHNLLLVHDDVFLHDVFLQPRISDALTRADIIGLAGSAGTDEDDPSWALAFSPELTPLGWHQSPRVRLHGAVSHTSTRTAPHDYWAPKQTVSLYGPTPALVTALDGLFLAMHACTVLAHGVRFDERFRFHCYDTDFCRSAVRAGLSLSTCPIGATHASAGNYDTEEWRAAATLYRQKWANPPTTERSPLS